MGWEKADVLISKGEAFSLVYETILGGWLTGRGGGEGSGLVISYVDVIFAQPLIKWFWIFFFAEMT